VGVYEHTLQTQRENFYSITGQVAGALADSGVKEGICVIYCPHTTAGITINENADPDVVTDMLLGLRETYPQRGAFLHFEGNSPAHLKSSAVGCSQTVIVRGGRLLLGRWQDIYFCEFDGPRTRRFYVKVMGD